MTKIALSQRDPPWADKNLGEDPGGPTIGTHGCLVTSLAMVCRKQFGTDVTPDKLNNALALAGTPFVQDHYLMWEPIPPLFHRFVEGLRSDRTYSAAELEQMQADGWSIILRQGTGDNTHFVYLDRVEGGRLWIIDPWWGEYFRKNPGGFTGVRALRREVEKPPRPQTLPGLHDRSGGDWMVENGVRGACTTPVYLKHKMEDRTPQYHLGLEYMIAAGVTPIISVRYHYATADGGDGTSPPAHLVAKFEDAFVELMRANPGCRFLYLNEQNNPREHPRGVVLTPEWFIASYNRVWARKPACALLAPGPIDPYNAASHVWHDWRITWRLVLDSIAGADFLAFHAYTHGPGPIIEQITSTKQFGDAPLVGVYYDMMVLKSQQEIVPVRFANLPQMVTEFNHFQKRNGEYGWDGDAGEYLKACYQFFSEHGIEYATAFRHNFDQWRMSDKSEILNAMKEMERGER